MSSLSKDNSSWVYVGLFPKDVELIDEALGILHSDYEGTSTLPPEKLARLKELERMFYDAKGTDKQTGHA
jgi:hypothetical protein